MRSIPKRYEGETVVILATGPSLNYEQASYVRKYQQKNLCKILTINNAFILAPWSDIHVACNDNWWEYYHCDPIVLKMTAEKWTRYERQAKEYNINFIDSVDKPGLSKDPNVVHINKGSGPLAINIATLYGFSKLILLGHDMSFAADYNGSSRQVGSSPRHFFGEYPTSMQHFPQHKDSVANGTLIGLISAYEKMVPDLDGIDVVNCTPGTKLPTFRLSTLEKEL